MVFMELIKKKKKNPSFYFLVETQIKLVNFFNLLVSLKVHF